MYALYALFEMFVPVLGRIGTEVIPDVAAAGMAVFAVISCSPFQVKTDSTVKPLIIAAL